jgi:hypothetical protein
MHENIVNNKPYTRLASTKSHAPGSAYEQRHLSAAVTAADSIKCQPATDVLTSRTVPNLSKFEEPL